MKTTFKTGLAAFMLLAISCSKETMHSPQVETTQTQDNVAVQTTAHFIGERFGGGIIFYIDGTGEHGYVADTVDLPPAVWWNGTNVVTGAAGTKIGKGKANTRKILKSQGQPISEAYNYVAWECHRSQRSGYNDWYLPSRDELNELYKQKNVVGDFADVYYWSSSERVFAGTVWGQYFGSGYQGPLSKAATSYVRAVRAF